MIMMIMIIIIIIVTIITIISIIRHLGNATLAGHRSQLPFVPLLFFYPCDDGKDDIRCQDDTIITLQQCNTFHNQACYAINGDWNNMCRPRLPEQVVMYGE